MYLECIPMCMCATSLQLYPTLCDPADCSPPGSSVDGLLQARILEWAAMPTFWPGDRTRSLLHLLDWHVGSLPLAPPRKPYISISNGKFQCCKNCNYFCTNLIISVTLLQGCFLLIVSKIYLCLFLAVLGLHCCTGFSLVAASRSALQFWCEGISFRWLLFLQSTGSRARGLQQLQLLGSRAQAQELGMHELSCSMACGILPGQGPNLCLPQWQVDSLPLSHQGSPLLQGFKYTTLTPNPKSAKTDFCLRLVLLP